MSSNQWPTTQSVPPFSATHYGPKLAAGLQTPPLPSLGAGQPNLGMRPTLRQLTVAEAFTGQTVHQPELARACLAGIWLLHHFLDESHQISQELHHASGSFWHAIMHRREGDYSNAKYWCHRVGKHPVLDDLAAAARELGYSYTDPFAFVDDVARLYRSGSPQERLAEQVQLLEWRLLFDYCYQTALQG